MSKVTYTTEAANQIEASTAFSSMVHYAVSEQSGTTAWTELVKHVHNERLNGQTVEEIENSLKATEAYYKDRFKQPLPGAWRSAKSTALKAARCRIPLMDEMGYPMGKSALDAKCREHTEAKVPLSPEVHAFQVLDKGLAVYKGNPALEVEFAQSVIKWLVARKYA